MAFVPVNMRCFTCLAKPRRKGRGYLFDGKGLKGKWVGGGRFEFRRADGAKFDSSSFVQVALLDPWASEIVKGMVVCCVKHGPLCRMDREDCRAGEREMDFKRWGLFISIGHDTLKIAVYRRPNVLRPKKIRRAAGAGFAVMLLMKDRSDG